MPAGEGRNPFDKGLSPFPRLPNTFYGRAKRSRRPHKAHASCSKSPHSALPIFPQGPQSFSPDCPPSLSGNPFLFPVVRHAGQRSATAGGSGRTRPHDDAENSHAAESRTPLRPEHPPQKKTLSPKNAPCAGRKNACIRYRGGPGGLIPPGAGRGARPRCLSPIKKHRRSLGLRRRSEGEESVYYRMNCWRSTSFLTSARCSLT